VRTRTAEELRGCDAGYRFTSDGASFPWRDRGVFIPSLSQVLEQFPQALCLIELKTVEAAIPVRRVLLRHGAANRVMVASFREAALVPFRAGGFLTSAARRSIFRLWAGSKLGLTMKVTDQAFSVPEYYRNRIPVPTPAFVAAARRAGCPVHVWTVNQPERAKALWARGVGGIITNFPGLMVETRRLAAEAEGTA
jgi:glycerophosphoryl diester phosphodiesterase